MKFIRSVINLIKKHKKFILYCLIGASGTIIDFALFALFLSFGLHYIIANTISIIIGMTNNFYWNAHYNFKRTDTIMKRYMSFLIVGFTGFILSNVALFVLIDMVKIQPLISKILIIIPIAIMQYFLNSRLTFKKNQK